MFELQKEKKIMYSDDRTIELTNYRVIYHESKNKKQILLADLVNYELKSAHLGNYKIITIIFAALTAWACFSEIPYYFENKKRLYADVSFPEYFIQNWALWFSSMFLALSLFFLAISRRYYVKINGKFDSIEFRVSGFRKRSIKKFLQTLDDQSKFVKKEEQKSL